MRKVLAALLITLVVLCGIPAKPALASGFTVTQFNHAQALSSCASGCTTAVTVTPTNGAPQILEIYTFNSSGCASVATPSGWTSEGSSGCQNTKQETWVFEKIGSNTDTSYSLTVTASTGTTYTNTSDTDIQGANTASIFDIVPTFGTGVGTTSINAPTITTTHNGDLLLSYWQNAFQASTGVTGGWTGVNWGSGITVFSTEAYETQSSAGSNGPPASTYGTAPSNYIAFSLAINAAIASPATGNNAVSSTQGVGNGTGSPNFGNGGYNCLQGTERNGQKWEVGGCTTTSVNPGNHVQVANYGCGFNGPNCTTVPISTQAKYISLAYQGADNAQYQAAGVSTIVYSNWNLCYPTDNPRTCFYELAPNTVCVTDSAGGPGSPPQWPAYSSALCTSTYVSQAAVGCNGSYVFDAHYGNGYINAPYISTANYAQIAKDRTGSPAENYIFGDDTGSNGGFTNGPPCNNGTSYSSSLWVSQMQAAQAALTNLGKPIFVNLLNADASGLTPVTLAPIANEPTIAGAMCENCFVKSSGTIDATSNWANDETGCLLVESYNKICWIYSSIGPITATNSAQLRLYAYASFLLSFGGNLSMFQEALSALTDTFMVLPETQLYPTNPVDSPGTAISNLAVTGGYRRRFNDCWYIGVDQGACEVVVNPNASGTMTISTTGYSRAVLISAGTATSDLGAGGTISLSGTPSTSVASQTAEILIH